MKADSIYEERVSSRWTEALFVGLALIFLILLVWRIRAGGPGVLSAVFVVLFIIFLFYSLNYRTLVIRLNHEALKLQFGVFTWTIPLDDIAECRHDDDLPLLVKYGGAGIHFILVRKRYRASFNFLEHPRVVIALKRKAGPVRDVSFSTRQPDEIVQLLQNAASSRRVSCFQ